jgi:polysaccharide export outer membrane protein
MILSLVIAAAGVLVGEKTALAAEQSAVGPGAAYVIGPGDVLEIGVWKEEALTRVVTVLPDGKISFPLIGEVAAAGRTVAGLKEELTASIGRFVPKPVVSVVVQQVNSLLIYVIGRVNSPGRFVLNTNVNVLQALALAGGPNAFAKRNKIKIIRVEERTYKVFNFMYDEASDGVNLEQNVWLKRGDVIFVP